MFSPNSPFAQPIANLFIWSLIISALILALIAGLVIYIVFRFRSRSPEEIPRQIAGHNRLEIAWTVTPALILAVMFGYTVYTMRAADPPINPNQQPDVIITGNQWWWRVEYPASGVVTANEIHIPTGKSILLRLNAADVIHDFWVPELGPKRDMVPGTDNHIWIAANKPGTYLGACAEYCGTQHAWMRLRVIAQPPAEFDAWLRQQTQSAAAPGGDVARGAQIYAQSTCVNCHAIQGGAGNAVAGPNLTHVGSRTTLGAGVIENTRDNLAKWIANPAQFKPGVLMPGYQQSLSADDIRALAAYLGSLK